MINKKFKVRVKHFSKNYYVVEYANYYLVPIYKPLQFWFEPDLVSGLECWSEKLFDYKSAEITANSIKSMTDIIKYHEEDAKKQSTFKIRKKQYLIDNVPYDTKNF